MEKKLKPFDLEAAKAGKPVVTRDGRPARIICFDREDIDYPIIALVRSDDDTEEAFSYTLNGVNWKDKKSNPDLFMAPTVKHTGWINIYKFGNSYNTFGGFKETKDEGIKDARFDPNYVTTVMVEWDWKD